MTSLAVLLAGYSVIAAGVVAVTQLRPAGDDVLSLRAGGVLLAALAGLQASHFVSMLGAPGMAHGLADWTDNPAYRLLLFTVAPAFFLYARALLAPRSQRVTLPQVVLHALPAAVGALLPMDIALPLAFLVGAGYLLWLGRLLYALRAGREQFLLEVRLLGGVFAIAVCVAVLGVFRASLPEGLFHELHAIAVGLAFVLVQVTLGLRPHLPVEVGETARAAYSNTTLSGVDCEAVVARLATLMQAERLYADTALSLPRLAGRLGITPHQLSELLNTRLGKGFARFLREHRVAAAKAMLLAEPAASVLSVGLAVGFSAQSNFYDAFREIEGMTPGQYRKLAGGAHTGG